MESLAGHKIYSKKKRKITTNKNSYDFEIFFPIQFFYLKKNERKKRGVNCKYGLILITKQAVLIRLDFQTPSTWKKRETERR